MKAWPGSTVDPGRYWLLSAVMGLGHDRAAWPLRSHAQNASWISIGLSDTSSRLERGFQSLTRGFYEGLSRWREHSRIGAAAFSQYDRMLQRFPALAEQPDQRRPVAANHIQNGLLRLGYSMETMTRIRGSGLPVISTFYMGSLAAERHTDLPVYSLICDVEFSRAWVPSRPKGSRIEYLAPTARSAERLMAYGVSGSRVHVTGFPLPLENVGDRNRDILLEDWRRRARRLADPTCPLTLLFCIGGAGVQASAARSLLDRMGDAIDAGSVRLWISAGVSTLAAERIRPALRPEWLESDRVRLIHEHDKPAYFQQFSQALHETDLVITKPSEMVFYAGLGLPILLTDPVGYHESLNAAWLLETGAGDRLPPDFDLDRIREMQSDGRLLDWGCRGLQTGLGESTHRILDLVAAPAT